jgi:hypothetical protein
MKLSYLALKVGRDTIVDIAFIVLEGNTSMICLKIIVYLSQIVAQNSQGPIILLAYGQS